MAALGLGLEVGFFGLVILFFPASRLVGFCDSSSFFGACGAIMLETLEATRLPSAGSCLALTLTRSLY